MKKNKIENYFITKSNNLLNIYVYIYIYKVCVNHDSQMQKIRYTVN